MTADIRSAHLSDVDGILLPHNALHECSRLVMVYYNLIRTQHWIGDLALVIERELFGQEPLNQIHGPTVGARLSEEIRRLAEVLLPLQERAQRMMLRGLDRLGR